MAQNRNNETEGKDEKKEERGEETSVRLKELFVRERGKKTSQCESCVSKGRYDRVAVFLCLVCEIYVCAGCMDEHRSHEGMKEERYETERMKVWKDKEPGVWGKLKRTVTKTFGLTLKSERKKEREESEREIMLGNFVDQLFSESETERKKELKKKNQVSICKQVNVKHELDRKNCRITGLCGLESRRWVVCDFDNSCIKISKLGSYVIQRYIRFVGSGPWDITEIDSAEPSLVSGSSSGISGTDRADPDKPCFIAVTLPGKHQIMFIDVGKKPALLHKVLYTERPCWYIQFYDDKIFTLCTEGPYGSPFSIYIKSTDGDTITVFYIAIHGYFPFFPYLAVISGRVYWTDCDNNKVQCSNVESQVIKDITIKRSRPVGISVDPDNNVYVCSLGHGEVYKLDADLTRYKSVLDQTTVYVGRPHALCYYRDKLFISHHVGPPSLRNVVTVVRLS